MMLMKDTLQWYNTFAQVIASEVDPVEVTGSPQAIAGLGDEYLPFELMAVHPLSWFFIIYYNGG